MSGRARHRAGTWRRRLVIMVKEPVAGRVKTRLASEIGNVRATAFYRRLSSNIIQRLRPDPRWQTVIAVTPDTALRSPIWPAAIARVGQGPGDLGQRMQRIMDQSGPGPVIIVGTDIARITPAVIAEAFARLAGADAILGPAGDGGYWLVGLGRSCRVPRAFREVRWSGPYALGDTRQNLAGARVAQAARLEDVDTAADFAALANAAARLILPNP